MRSIFVTYLSAVSLAGATWFERDDNNSILNELGIKLSPSAKIILQGDSEFENATKRWQTFATPHFIAVVDVRSEQDVQETVRYANHHSIPFLAVSSTHGSIASASLAKKAIQISLRNLNSIAVSADGTFATVGGGLKSKALIDHLYPLGKQTVTGGCECVGLTAPALGGGHGFLQGYYGLLSDQILSMRIVLADGSIVTASEDENQDLFWAMRGAGHNFGIVTSMEYRIYDVPEGKEVWSWEAFTLPATSENVRRVYEIADANLDTVPLEMAIQYGLVLQNPAVADVPVVMMNVAFNGALTGARQYTQPYHDLEGVVVNGAEGTYLDVPRWMQIDEAGSVCNIQDFMPGAAVMRYPVDVQVYNVSALVATVQKFVEIVTENPEFAGSFMMLEQYSSHAVREANPSSGAYGLRQDKLLLAPALLYTRSEALDEKARKYREEMRQILIDGAKNMGGSHSYVNYAYGGESLEELYGTKELERLLALKRKYDPHNWFGFYAPLMSSSGNYYYERHNEL